MKERHQLGYELSIKENETIYRITHQDADISFSDWKCRATTRNENTGWAILIANSPYIDIINKWIFLRGSFNPNNEIRTFTTYDKKTHEDIEDTLKWFNLHKPSFSLTKEIHRTYNENSQSLTSNRLDKPSIDLYQHIKDTYLTHHKDYTKQEMNAMLVDYIKESDKIMTLKIKGSIIPCNPLIRDAQDFTSRFIHHIQTKHSNLMNNIAIGT